MGIYLLATRTTEQKYRHISTNNRTASRMQTSLSVTFVAGSVFSPISSIWKHFCSQADFCFIILILMFSFSSTSSFFPLLCLNHLFVEGGKRFFFFSPAAIGRN